MIMLSAEETTWKFNGKRLGDIMLLLFRANNAHDPVSEAEISGYYKDIMLNRENKGEF